MTQVYPRVEKVSASSFSSRGLFFSSIWTVQPRSDCQTLAGSPDLGKWKFPLSKSISSFRFSTSEQLLSSSMELLFCPIWNLLCENGNLKKDFSKKVLYYLLMGSFLFLNFYFQIRVTVMGFTEHFGRSLAAVVLLSNMTLTSQLLLA